ncbi:hypothetical protein PQX77_010937 [Marasmius sp. AFHP31]|nr:hypothetical protein PQX77_010937 [Marasmius sp. AFHP31]
MAHSAILPPEIIHQILQHLDGNVYNLRVAALISHAWCGPSQSLLHSSINLDSEAKIEQLTKKYALYPHLRAYCNYVFLDGYRMISFSEGMLLFEKTVMADGFEKLIQSLGEKTESGDIGGIKGLSIDSYQGWDEEMSRRISVNFPSLETLEIARMESDCDMPGTLGRLLSGMNKLTSLALDHVFPTRGRGTYPPEPQRAPIRLTHLTVSPANPTAPSDIFPFLMSPMFDHSRLRSLKIGWLYSLARRGPANPLLQSFREFISIIGPQITRLTIATPLRYTGADEARNMNLSDALGDLLSIRLLNYFPSVKQLTLYFPSPFITPIAF